MEAEGLYEVSPEHHSFGFTTSPDHLQQPVHRQPSRGRAILPEDAPFGRYRRYESLHEVNRIVGDMIDGPYKMYLSANVVESDEDATRFTVEYLNLRFEVLRSSTP